MIVWKTLILMEKRHYQKETPKKKSVEKDEGSGSDWKRNQVLKTRTQMLMKMYHRLHTTLGRKLQTNSNACRGSCTRPEAGKRRRCCCQINR